MTFIELDFERREYHFQRFLLPNIPLPIFFTLFSESTPEIRNGFGEYFLSPEQIALVVIAKQIFYFMQEPKSELTRLEVELPEKSKYESYLRAKDIVVLDSHVEDGGMMRCLANIREEAAREKEFQEVGYRKKEDNTYGNNGPHHKIWASLFSFVLDSHKPLL